MDFVLVLGSLGSAAPGRGVPLHCSPLAFTPWRCRSSSVFPRRKTLGARLIC